MGKVNIYSLDRNGFAQTIIPEAFDWFKIKQENVLVWVHLDLTVAEKFLQQHMLVSETIIDMLCAHETRPRVLIFDNSMLASFRAINLNTGQNPEDMTSIRMWLSEQLIITVKRRTPYSVIEIQRMLTQGQGPKCTSDFLSVLLTHITTHTDQLLDEYDQKLDQIEQDVKNEKPIILADRVNEICKKIIRIRRYILPQREAILAISAHKLTWLDDDDIFDLRQTLDSNIRLLEDLDAMKDRSLIIQAQIHSYEQNQINKRMYILSLVSVIFIPLGFITGLLGINVAGIPGSEHRHGFLIVCILLVIIMVVHIFIMRKIKWV